MFCLSVHTRPSTYACMYDWNTRCRRHSEAHLDVCMTGTLAVGAILKLIWMDRNPNPPVTAPVTISKAAAVHPGATGLGVSSSSILLALLIGECCKIDSALLPSSLLIPSSMGLPDRAKSARGGQKSGKNLSAPQAKARILRRFRNCIASGE